MHDQSIETLRNILEYIALKNPYVRDFGPEIEQRSAETFSVIFVEPI